MSVPAELRYTAEHEWVAIEGETATIGITDFAAQALGDVVFVSLPTVGATVSAGDPCGEVESYKSVSELYSPVTGEVTAVNEELNDDPALINAEPYQPRLDIPGAADGRRGGHHRAALAGRVRRAHRVRELTTRCLLPRYLRYRVTCGCGARSGSR